MTLVLYYRTADSATRPHHCGVDHLFDSSCFPLRRRPITAIVLSTPLCAITPLASVGNASQVGLIPERLVMPVTCGALPPAGIKSHCVGNTRLSRCVVQNRQTVQYNTDSRKYEPRWMSGWIGSLDGQLGAGSLVVYWSVFLICRLGRCQCKKRSPPTCSTPRCTLLIRLIVDSQASGRVLVGLGHLCQLPFSAWTRGTLTIWRRFAAGGVLMALGLLANLCPKSPSFPPMAEVGSPAKRDRFLRRILVLLIRLQSSVGGEFSLVLIRRTVISGFW